ncbi:MAG: protoheme IX farnesyltransferase [Candidatus Omnitrophica bacterium]|nr:protoheme IX farnesyltransferase [Candidatus Omnitrophota bacterium]
MKKKYLLAYLELSKPRILTLVLVTTTIGYYLGAKGLVAVTPYLKLLMGIALTCGGSSALNHYLEREYDSKMERTQNRPIPSGVIMPSHALAFGICLVLLGITVLYTQVNILAAFLCLLAAFLYIMVYTPMKRVSALSTTVGAFPGAIPPLAGWAAATGTLNFDAGTLFLILFIWQHPHFYAITWMFREDYKKAGFKILLNIASNGEASLSHIKWCTLALIPVSMIPTLRGLSGYFYLIGILLSGIALLFVANSFVRSQSNADGRKLLKATVMYIPALLILIVLDSTFASHLP